MARKHKLAILQTFPQSPPLLKTFTLTWILKRKVSLF